MVVGAVDVGVVVAGVDVDVDAPTVVLVSTGDYAHAVRGCGAAGFIPKARLSGATLRAAIGAA